MSDNTPAAEFDEKKIDATFVELRAGPVSDMAQAAQGPVLSASPSFQLLLLTIASTAASYTFASLGPLQETMRIALALSDNQMALLQGPALALPVVLTIMPFGLAIDRYSRARLLFILAVFNMAGSIFTALAANFAMLFVARCLIGTTAVATATAAFALLPDLCPPVQRGRASMVLIMGQTGGFAAAFAAGGALLARFASGPNSWRWAMLWMTAPLVLVMLLLLIMREPPRTGVAVQTPSTRQACVELWHNRAAIVPLTAGYVIIQVPYYAVLSWTAPTFARNFALPPARIGAIMGTGVLLSGIVGSIAGGPLADLCQRTGGPRRTISVLSWVAFLCVPAGLFSLMPGAGLASMLLVVLMTIICAICVTGMALFTIVVPNEVLGFCMAAQMGAGAIFGVALAPMAVSALSGALGGLATIGKALALVCASASLLAAAAFALGIRYLPRTAVE